MNSNGIDYGNWLNTLDWNLIATFRPHYKLNPSTSDKLIERLSKDRSINKVFYCLENDRDIKSIHCHLLLDANSTLSRKELANKLNVNDKSVSYLMPILDKKAVALYCSKYLTLNNSHHNLFY